MLPKTTSETGVNNISDNKDVPASPFRWVCTSEETTKRRRFGMMEEVNMQDYEDGDRRGFPYEARKDSQTWAHRAKHRNEAERVEQKASFNLLARLANVRRK